MKSTLDPRSRERDLRTLLLPARMKMLHRKHLKDIGFTDVSETVVKRALDRLVERKLLGLERLHGNGPQVIWCTQAGADLLVAENAALPADLFPARGPVAGKDFDHHSAILDALTALHARGYHADKTYPAWQLQRLHDGAMTVIPDLLHLDSEEAEDRKVALAVEVDLATEPLRSVLVPKTRALADFLAGYGRDSRLGILILTRGGRRASSIKAAIEPLGLPVSVAVDDLERFCGLTGASEP